MKIAVLSDIHGNLPALQTVAAHIEKWRPDLVVVDGDIVSRGPLSLACLRFIRMKQRCDDWQVVKGNHEELVLACGRADSPRTGPEFEVHRFAHWTYQQLNGEISSLLAMPDRFSWNAPDGSEFRVVHASMQNNRDGIYVNTPDDYLETQISPIPAVFVTAHTHRPLIRTIHDTIVVNVGAVGAPFDLDWRASYGQFTWGNEGWRAEVVRLEYDRQQTERDYVESGFLAEAGPLAQLMLVELRKARGLIYRWAAKYEEAVMAKKITVEESVREMMGAKDVRPYLGPPGWTL
jgi:predicted phosphodiesterase